MHRNLICLLVIAAAGCSSSPQVTPPPSSAAPDKAAVIAWVDQVCAANKPIITISAVVSQAPKFAQGQVPTEADRPAVIASLTELRDRYTRAKTAYDGIGPSPIPRGDELVAGHRKGLTELVPKLQGYLDKAGKVPARSIDSAMLLAGLDAVTWKPEGPGLGDLRDTQPALAEAYRQAPNCQN